MTGIANGHIANQQIYQKIDEGGGNQSRQCQNRLVSSEEIEACGDAKSHNYDASRAAEIFLDIERVMTARYTSGDNPATKE